MKEPVIDRSLYEKVVVPFSEEELDRAEQEPGGRALDAILSDLQKSKWDAPSRKEKRPGE